MKPIPSSLILQNSSFETWTSAIKTKSSAGRGGGKKQEFYGIKKLRELILELAVRGLLVEQDPEDEPACVLIERVSDSLPDKRSENPFLHEIEASINDESEYKIPNGWAWIPLGHMGIWAAGCGFPTKYQGKADKEFLFCKVSDMNLPGNEVEIQKTLHTIDSEVLKKIRARSNPVGTVIFPKIGGAIATHKRRVIIKPTIIDNNCSGIQPIGLTNNQWLLLLMRSIDLTKYQSGTSVPAVSQNSLNPIRIGLPPLAEQHRIVAKVDELMTLCDQQERQQEDSLRTHDTLVKTLLEALTATSERRQFEEAWKRIESNFDTLFTTESSIDQLKQTILQLAVMGKLVEQDPEDEPAEELLRKINSKKNDLVIEGKIKKQRASFSSIPDAEFPFEKPKNWEFCRLKESSYVFSGNAFKSGDFNNQEGVRVIKITNAGVGELIETDEFLPKALEFNHEDFRVSAGDLILALTRPYISTGLKVSICPDNYDGALLNQRVAAIRCFADRDFLYLYMQSIYVLGLYQKRFSGSGLQPNLKMADVTELVTPLPPLAEQHRIVAKVDELMTLCDQLKANLQKAQTTQLHLADSLVEAAIR